MATKKIIYWDNKHLAGYKVTEKYGIIEMDPVNGGVPQKWSSMFFEGLLKRKEVVKCNIGEYEELVLKSVNLKRARTMGGVGV